MLCISPANLRAQWMRNHLNRTLPENLPFSFDIAIRPPPSLQTVPVDGAAAGPPDQGEVTTVRIKLVSNRWVELVAELVLIMGQQEAVSGQPPTQLLTWQKSLRIGTAVLDDHGDTWCDHVLSCAAVTYLNTFLHYDACITKKIEQTQA